MCGVVMTAVLWFTSPLSLVTPLRSNGQYFDINFKICGSFRGCCAK